VVESCTAPSSPVRGSGSIWPRSAHGLGSVVSSPPFHVKRWAATGWAERLWWGRSDAAGPLADSGCLPISRILVRPAAPGARLRGCLASVQRGPQSRDPKHAVSRETIARDWAAGWYGGRVVGWGLPSFWLSRAPMPGPRHQPGETGERAKLRPTAHSPQHTASRELSSQSATASSSSGWRHRISRALLATRAGVNALLDSPGPRFVAPTAPDCELIGVSPRGPPAAPSRDRLSRSRTTPNPCEGGIEPGFGSLADASPHVCPPGPALSCAREQGKHTRFAERQPPESPRIVSRETVSRLAAPRFRAQRHPVPSRPHSKPPPPPPLSAPPRAVTLRRSAQLRPHRRPQQRRPATCRPVSSAGLPGPPTSAAPTSPPPPKPPPIPHPTPGSEGRVRCAS